MKSILFYLAISLMSLNFYAQVLQHETPKYLDLSLDFETRALDLVQQMTLDEKISQLGNSAPAIERLGVDEYNWWNECLHGVARAGNATVFPQAIGMAATFDTEMMNKVANVISDEARAKHHEALRNQDFRRYYGLTFWSPNINIFRDPRWGRGHETYGEDPYLTGQMGMQFVKGLQGDDPKYLKLVATAKHFAVHNGPEPERHTFNVTPNTRDLWETYLPAFEDLMVDAKAYSIMSAYNRVDGESASASWLLLEDILRKQWGFEGYVVSDCGAIRDIHAFHKIVNTPEEAAAVGVRKGCDLNCGSVYQKYLKKAVDLGLIDEGEIDLSLYRLMLSRMKLGMFDPVENVPYAQIPFEVNEAPAHDDLALEMALKSMTLLKNDGTLPLNMKKLKRIAVVGPNAKNIEALRANYYGVASHPVSIIDGIRNAVDDDVEVSYSKGVSLVIDDMAADESGAISSDFLFTVDDDGNKITGLKGEYFNNMNLEGEPAFTRIDANVNFMWGASPTATELAQGIVTSENSIPDDQFSIRWTGNIVAPTSGSYTIGVRSDDGCRLWINGEKVVDGWYNHSSKPFFSYVDLIAGNVNTITLEYFDNTNEGSVELAWTQAVDGQEKRDVSTLALSSSTIGQVKNADVAIFVGGLDATWEGEEMRGRVGIDGFDRGDRTHIELPKIQLDAIRDMISTGTPVILVLMSGSAIAFDGLEQELAAVLLGWYPGQRGGDAVADVLFGYYNPAGRLPVTFYSSTSDLPDFRDYNMRSGKGFTYRYYQGDALFPFGYGLSYTTFKYDDLELDKTEISDDEEVTVSFTIKNDGKLAGDEVVQLYIRDLASDKWMPIKQLRKFDRVYLEKGEERIIEFKINAKKDLRYYNAMAREYQVEPGDFEIQIGASSQDVRLRAVLTVE